MPRISFNTHSQFFLIKEMTHDSYPGQLTCVTISRYILMTMPLTYFYEHIKIIASSALLYNMYTRTHFSFYEAGRP